MAATTGAAVFCLFSAGKVHSSIDTHASICFQSPSTFYRVLSLQSPCLRAINLHSGPLLTTSQSKPFSALQESVLLFSEEKEQEENDEDKDPKEKQENTDDPKQENSSPPVPGTKIYVKHLPYSCDAKEITEMFKQCGTVVSAEIIKFQQTGRSKGYAFVTMGTVEEATKAIEIFHKFEMGKRSLSVNFSKIQSKQLFPDIRPRHGEHYNYVDSPHKIYAANLAWTVNAQSLGEFFKACPNLLGAKVIYQKKTGKSRGYGFVSFASENDATAAKALLNGKDLEGRPVQLSMVKKRLATKETSKG